MRQYRACAASTDAACLRAAGRGGAAAGAGADAAAAAAAAAAALGSEQELPKFSRACGAQIFVRLRRAGRCARGAEAFHSGRVRVSLSVSACGISKKIVICSWACGRREGSPGDKKILLQKSIDLDEASTAVPLASNFSHGFDFSRAVEIFLGPRVVHP